MYLLPATKSLTVQRSPSVKVVACDRAPETTEYEYKSSYTANVQLLAGGADVEKDHVYTASLNGKEYKVKVKKVTTSYVYKSDKSVSYTTATDASTGPIDVGEITGALTNSIQNLTGFSAETTGNVIRVRRTNPNKDFNISARGGSTENAMYAIKDRVNDISKLPTIGFDGSILKVQNSVDSEADDYYVMFQTSGGVPGAGSWIEVAKPGLKTSFNGSTMPHALIRQSDGNFRLIT